VGLLRLPADPGLSGVRLDVLLPRPVSYQIALLDAEIGSPLEGGACWVVSCDPRNAQYISSAPYGRADATGNPFTVRKLQGALRVTIPSQGVMVHQMVDGSQELSIVLPIHSPRKLDVGLVSAGPSYLRPWGWWTEVQLEPIAPADGRLTTITLAGSALPEWASEGELFVSRAGRYRCLFPPLDHGVLIPDREVVVGDGPNRLEVDLTEWTALLSERPKER
jgi:hypothetical protein